MATIQLRDVPDDAYEAIRRRAHAAGQSLQAYMREHVIEFASTPTTAEAWAEIETTLAEFGGTSASIEQIVQHLHEDRR